MAEARVVEGCVRLPGCDSGALRGLGAAAQGGVLAVDPPTGVEIILAMREAGPGPYGDGVRGLIAILWRASLRLSRTLALAEPDLDPETG